MWHNSQNHTLKINALFLALADSNQERSSIDIFACILIYEPNWRDKFLTLLNGWLQTIFTLSHLRCTVPFCSWLGPKKRTRFMLVPLRLSVGDMKEDITRITWNAERQIFIHTLKHMQILLISGKLLLHWRWLPHSPALWQLKNCQPKPQWKTIPHFRCQCCEFALPSRTERAAGCRD